jgi:predicted HTH domain antitoxin
MNSPDTSKYLKALISIGIYQSEDEVIQDALQHLLQAHPDYRLKVAIYRYRLDDISLGKAADIAGVSMEGMKQALIDNGVQPRLGPRTVEEAQSEVRNIRGHMSESDHK